MSVLSASPSPPRVSPDRSGAPDEEGEASVVTEAPGSTGGGARVGFGRRRPSGIRAGAPAWLVEAIAGDDDEGNGVE
eukprot:3039377-Rhodomonas_salina.1